MKEVVSLMYLISVYDPFFDTHLKQCEYWYVFVLNRLSYLFSTAKEEEQMDEGWFCYEVDITLLLLFCSSKTWYLAKKLMIVDVSIIPFYSLSHNNITRILVPNKASLELSASTPNNQSI